MSNQIVKKDLQNFKNKQLETQLENTTCNESITIVSTSILNAFKRTGVDISEVKLIDSVDFIKSEFKDISIDTLTKALKKGASGHYGKTYRMCDQELCIWIRTYLEENTKKQTGIKPYDTLAVQKYMLEVKDIDLVLERYPNLWDKDKELLINHF